MADQPLNALTKRRQAANMTEAGKRALGHQLAPYIRSYVDASKFGVVYDTTIDSSVAVQAAIDASKGKALVFTGAETDRLSVIAVLLAIAAAGGILLAHTPAHTPLMELEDNVLLEIEDNVIPEFGDA